MSDSLFPLKPILMVDDEASWLKSFSFSLEYEAGITNIRITTDSREVLNLLSREAFSLVLLDLTMPHLSGEELLPRIVEAHPDVSVIVISGMNQIETAVRCIKLGAFDFIVKTTERDRLFSGIRNALALRQARDEVQHLKNSFFRKELNSPESFSGILTQDGRMRSLFRYIEGVSTSRQPLLITGESGVGKDLIARSLHTASSPKGEFIAVNVAGLDDQMFSDTLFGHVRGAFTGADRARPGLVERAQGGTLFLDEIGDLSPASQVKLLRFLQDGEYYPLGSNRPQRGETRVVCATNRDISDGASGFRKDLYYRLNTHHVHIPPLRERKEDIRLLVHYFLEEAAQEMQKNVPALPKELLTLLENYPFPGNVRELRSMIFNALSQHRGGILSLSTFREHIQAEGETVQEFTDHNPFSHLSSPLPNLQEASRLLVMEAMERSGGNQTIAAAMLGITQQALSKRLKKYDC